MTTAPPPLHPPTPAAAIPLQGRDGELEVLQAAVLQPRRSGAQVVWISGEAGVGKTALVQQLREPVQRVRGRFALGKCEQFLGSDVLQAPRQALRQVLLQLLTPPHAPALAELSLALQTALGRDAAALVPLLPELQRFIGEPLPQPPALEAYEVPQRLLSLLVALLRELARLCRPLLLVLDDLQWADPLTLDLLRAVLDAPDLHGLVVIGLLRPSQLEDEAPLDRLLLQASSAPTPPLHLELRNLTREQVTALLAERLDSAPEPLAPLAERITDCTGGNPFFVIERLRTLQREGLLRRAPESQDWLWEPGALSRRLGNRDVVSLLCDTLTELPALCRDALLTLACLGSRARLRLLGQATGLEAGALLDALQPALELGILVWCQETPPGAVDPDAALGFGHDRLQQAVLQLIETSALQRLHLALARRLLRCGERRLAAEHYGQATPLLEAPDERREVLLLLREAGAAALSAGGFAMADRFHRLAWQLLGARPWQADQATAWSLQVSLHQLAYCRAEYRRGDAHYRLLEHRAETAEQLLEPTAIQVLALSNRGHHQEAVDLAARLLQRLGHPMPTQAPQPALERELQALQEAVQAGALARLPPLPRQAPGGSVAKLMNRLVPAAFFCNPPLAHWLVLHSTQQWLAGDAHPARLYPLACTLLASVALRGDYATGHHAARAALAIGEASGHGVETARTRHVFSLFCCHWFEPLESALAQARLAHRDLQRWGEQDFACYTFYTSQAALLDCGSSLAELAAENARAVSMARRSGNRHAEPAYAAFSALIEALRDPAGDGDPDPVPGEPERDGATDSAAEAIQALERSNAMGACYVHLCRALAACLLNDPPGLRHHAEAAGRLEPYITGFYPVALIRLLQLLALLWERNATPDAAEQERLEALQAWFRARAADAPRNFAHLEALIAAERHLAEGQGAAALPLYERAMRLAISHQRPWHAALACERAARCYLQLGLDQAGQHLIEQAQRRYAAWGAARKSLALQREFPLLGANRPLAHDGHRLLETSQALARLRTLPELVEATAQLIGDLSGASDVQIVALDSEGQWQLRGGFCAAGPLERQPLEQAERDRLLPATALRLCLDNLQPLVCDDAVLDPRIACDSYLEGLACCSLLVVPVVQQQRAIAAVLASHRQQRGAFAVDQVEAVQLLCGHLGVALETLLIQQSLERQVQERSDALRRAYERESRQAERQRDLLRQKLKTSLMAAATVHEIQQPLAAILLTCRLAMQDLEAQAQPPLPVAVMQQLRPLAEAVDQVSITMERMQLLLRNVETEPSPLDLSSTLHSALTFLRMELRRRAVDLHHEGLEHPCPMRGDAAQLQMAVVNLIRNALQAMERQPSGERRLRLQLERAEAEQELRIRIADSGPGFPEDFHGCESSWETLQSSRATGLGIGLFLAQTAASNHGGDLRIGRSAALGGAEVVIALPAPQMATAAPCHREMTETAAGF